MFHKALLRRRPLRALGALLVVTAFAMAPVGGAAAATAATATATSTAAPSTPSPTSTIVTAGASVSSATLGTMATSVHTNAITTPAITQQYALDCEAAALQAALAARGTNVTQDWILQQIGADTTPAVRDAAGNIVAWGNPYATFVGNVNGSEVTGTGYGVYYAPIAAAARAAGHTAIGGVGWTLSDIVYAVSSGYPVVVWTDTTYTAVPTSTYTAWDGTVVKYAVGEHAVTVTGVNLENQTVQLLDVETGSFLTFSMAQFAGFWSTFGNMAVIVQ
jgi:uncharacterized protein YvpB